MGSRIPLDSTRSRGGVAGSTPRKPVELSPAVSDEVKCTTCYMCACRCGIKVHLKDGAIRYIEGNRDHPVNRGVLCAKGSAGIMQHYSPARLRKPLKRVGERGSGDFVAAFLVGGPNGFMIANIVQTQFGSALNWPLGAALSIVMLVIVLTIISVSDRLERTGRIDMG